MYRRCGMRRVRLKRLSGRDESIVERQNTTTDRWMQGNVNTRDHAEEQTTRSCGREREKEGESKEEKRGREREAARNNDRQLDIGIQHPHALQHVDGVSSTDVVHARTLEQ